MSASLYTHPLLGGEIGEWTWCFRCERVYRTEQWIAHDWTCPGCIAGPVDAFGWSQEAWPRSQHPEYPVTPIEGMQYTRRAAVQAH